MPERIPQSVTIRVPLEAYLTGTTTPATGKTIVITISKNGAAYGNPSGGATNATEIGNGSYYVDLSTTDTGTAGPLIVLGTNADIDNVKAHYNVVNAHNAGFDGVPNAAANANGGLPILSVGGTTLAYTVSTLTTYTGNTPQTGDSFARIGINGAGLTALAPASTALSTGNWPNGLASSLTTLAGHDPGSTLASASSIVTLASMLTVINTQNVKTLAAVYDSATSDGVDTLTLSNGATQQINLTTGARTTVG